MGEDERAELHGLLDDVGRAFFWALVLGVLWPVTWPWLLYRMLGLPGALHGRSPTASRLVAASLALGAGSTAVLAAAAWFGAEELWPSVPLFAVLAAGLHALGWATWCDAIGWRRIGRCWRRASNLVATAWALAFGAAQLSTWHRLVPALLAVPFGILALDRLGRAAASTRVALVPEREQVA